MNRHLKLTIIISLLQFLSIRRLGNIKNIGKWLNFPYESLGLDSTLMDYLLEFVREMYESGMRE